jgi:hypothetical protein
MLAAYAGRAGAVSSGSFDWFTLGIILGLGLYIGLQFTRRGRERWARRWAWIDLWVLTLFVHMGHDILHVYGQAREELLALRMRWQMR